MDTIRDAVEALFIKVPAHHGMPHLRRVVEHVELASADLSADQRFVVVAAAWLHEVDDHKLQRWLPNRATNESRAAQILRNATAPTHLVPDIIKAVRLCTTAGQSQVEAEYGAAEGGGMQPWLLIPRDADRLDALNVDRCVAYGRDVGTCLFIATTVRPHSVDEMLAAATPERFTAYKNGYPSASTIDHFYDKLLQITCDDSEAGSGREGYFTKKFPEARQKMIEDLFALVDREMPK